jgi:hypothetical protein
LEVRVRFAQLLILSLLLSSVGCSSATTAVVEGREFYPATPLVRTFSYSRIAPDGSTLLGTITFGIRPQDSGGEAPASSTFLAGHPVEARVTFVAGGVAFSPQQAQAMHPMIDWPTSNNRYPIGVPDVEEDFAYHAVVGKTASPELPVSPADAAMFWAQGVFSYLGMPRPPTAFVTTSVTFPGDPQAVCIRGAFKRDSDQLGSFVFTLRKDHGLSSISATLADGTLIGLVERTSHPLDEHNPAPREEPLFASLPH